LALVSTISFANSGEATSLKPGAVYCISRLALVEQMMATAEADSDRLYDVLWRRKLCDYAQARVPIRILEELPSDKALKVKLSSGSGPWRKGSKITIPKDLVVFVRRSGVE
jgi:hypothetical protein